MQEAIYDVTCLCEDVDGHLHQPCKTTLFASNLSRRLRHLICFLSLRLRFVRLVIFGIIFSMFCIDRSRVSMSL